MKRSEVKNPGSKPVKWSDDRCRQVYTLALLMLTEKEIAEVMDVSEETILHWKRTKPEFFQALERGRTLADAKMAKSLHRCGMGYYYKEEQAFNDKGTIIKTWVTKYKHPEAWAANKWLSVRQKARWSESQTIDINTNFNLKLDLSTLSLEDLKLLQRISSQMKSKDEIGEVIDPIDDTP